MLFKFQRWTTQCSQNVSLLTSFYWTTGQQKLSGDILSIACCSKKLISMPHLQLNAVVTWKLHMPMSSLKSSPTSWGISHTHRHGWVSHIWDNHRVQPHQCAMIRPPPRICEKEYRLHWHNPCFAPEQCPRAEEGGPQQENCGQGHHRNVLPGS